MAIPAAITDSFFVSSSFFSCEGDCLILTLGFGFGTGGATFRGDSSKSSSSESDLATVADLVLSAGFFLLIPPLAVVCMTVLTSSLSKNLSSNSSSSGKLSGMSSTMSLESSLFLSLLENGLSKSFGDSDFFLLETLDTEDLLSVLAVEDFLSGSTFSGALLDLADGDLGDCLVEFWAVFFGVAFGEFLAWALGELGWLV